MLAIKLFYKKKGLGAVFYRLRLAAEAIT